MSKRPDPRAQEAQSLRAAGRLPEARDLYAAITRDRPRDARAFCMLAQVLHQLADLPSAQRAAERAAKLDPTHAEHHLTLARILHQAGEGADALAGFERARYFDPKLVLAHCGVAAVHEQSGDLKKAREAIDRAIDADPEDPQSLVIRARLMRRAGELDRALAALDELAAKPLRDAQMQRVLFERGRVLDKLGRRDEAYECFVRANETQSRTPPAQSVNPDQIFAQIDQLGAIPPADARSMLERTARDAPNDDGEAPAFLVGFDRSGTTMTEQILGAHPRVSTTDERPLVHETIGHMLTLFPKGTGFAEMLRDLDAEQIRELRAVYRDRAARLGAKGTLLLDKFPLNILNALFINRVFPESRLLVCLRDPRDTCLSCFFQEFAPNTATVNFYTPQRTVELYNAVMGLWIDQRDALTMPTQEVRYEETVADLEASARAILQFLGLDWDDRVLSFHDPEATGNKHRFVSTPSYEGVTERVHTGAVGRWRRYPAFAEHAEALSLISESLGYA